MGHVEVDSPNVGIPRHYEIQSRPNSSSHIHQFLNLLKTLLGIQNLVHEHVRIIRHSPIENPVESLIDGLVLECIHSMGFSEWLGAFKNNILEIKLGIHQHLILIHQDQWSQRDSILVLHKIFAESSEAIEPLGLAILVRGHRAAQNRLAG